MKEDEVVLTATKDEAAEVLSLIMACEKYGRAIMTAMKKQPDLELPTEVAHFMAIISLVFSSEKNRDKLQEWLDLAGGVEEVKQRIKRLLLLRVTSELKDLLTEVESAPTLKPHKHKCECGFIWDHDPAKFHDDQTGDAFKRAHSCPKCGAKQDEIYKGKGKSMCHNDGVHLQMVN